MNENIKLSTYVGIAFLISFGILLSFFELVSNEIYDPNTIDKINFNHENKIFILGTSYVEAIDSLHVKNILHKNNVELTVINPPSSHITFSLDRIDKVLANNPILIVYGVGFQDVGYLINDSCHNLTIPKYVPKNHLENTLKISSQTDFEPELFTIFSQNPKHTTIKFLETLFENNYTSKINLNVDPSEIALEDHYELHQHIRSISDLNKGDPTKYCMDFELRNNELDSLNEMFSKFEENNIHVITFIPPYTKAYLDKLPLSQRLDLSENIEKISISHGFAFYDLSSKFENTDIFTDHSHVAINPRSLVYSEEIASLILNEFVEIDFKLPSNENFDKDFIFMDFSGKILSGMDFSQKNLYGAKFFDTELVNTNFKNTILRNTNLSDKDLTGTILTGADLSGAILQNVDLSDKDLTGTILTGADLSNSNLSGADLTNKDLSGAILQNVDLSDKDLTEIILNGADLSNSNLSGADLTGSDLQRTILQNVDLSDSDLTGTILWTSNLSGADLTGTILTGADLSGSILQNVDLSGTNLEKTKFTNARIFDTKLNKVTAIGADFSNAFIDNSLLNQSQFDNSTFRSITILNSKSLGALMSNSDFSNSEIIMTNFQGSFFERSIFLNSSIVNSDLSFSHFSDAYMINLLMNNTDIYNADFDSVILENPIFINVDMDCIAHIICK